MSYPTSQQSALSCITEEECCKCHWHVLQLTDTAGSDQAEISSLALRCCGQNRKQDSCLVRVWAVKQSCPTGKQNKNNTKTPIPARNNTDICQVSESPCIQHLAKGNRLCKRILFLLCSFSSSCPSFHFYSLSPSIFYPKVHFRNSRAGTKVNILDFSHQFCSTLLRLPFQGCYNTVSAPFSSLPLQSLSWVLKCIFICYTKMAYINYIFLVQCHIALFYYAAKKFLSKNYKKIYKNKREREKEKKGSSRVVSLVVVIAWFCTQKL